MIPAPSEIRACTRCSEPILWTITAAGKRMAVDPHPADDGNQACYRVSPGTWQSRSLSAADALPLARWEHRYRPHVASCTPKTKPKPPPRTPRAAQQHAAMYDVLGVTRTATPEQIRTAYRRLARQLHPDVNPGGGDRFKQVTEAYDVLSDPDSRAVYDQTGRRPRARRP